MTSVLLYYMAFVFMGKGVRELQEGNALPITLIPGFPTVEALGLLSRRGRRVLAQLVLLALFVFARGEDVLAEAVGDAADGHGARRRRQSPRRSCGGSVGEREVEARLAMMEIGQRRAQSAHARIEATLATPTSERKLAQSNVAASLHRMNVDALFASPWGALVIFRLRIVDVSCDTMRVIFAIRGKRGIAAVLGFVQALVWIFAVGNAVKHLDSVLHVLGYAGGYAMGTFVGVSLEQAIAYGVATVRIVSRSTRASRSPRRCGAGGYGVTEFPGFGRDGAVEILNSVVQRRDSTDVLDDRRRSRTGRVRHGRRAQGAARRNDRRDATGASAGRSCGG